MDATGTAAKAIAPAKAVAVARRVAEPALVAVTTVGAAAQAAQEPQHTRRILLHLPQPRAFLA